MADLFYDAFDGSGGIANHVPDVGDCYWLSSSIGQIDGSLKPYLEYLSGYGYRTTFRAETTRFLYLPESKVMTMDFAIRLASPDNRSSIRVTLLDSSGTETLTISISFGVGLPTLPYIECSFSDYYGTQGVPAITSIVVPGDNRFLLSMDYEAKTVDLWINDVSVYNGFIPEGDESWTVPPPTTSLAVNIYGGSTYWVGSPMSMEMSYLRITDEAPGLAGKGLFWENILKASEIP